MRIGTATPTAFRLGATAVSKLYLGATEVWSPGIVLALTETGAPDYEVQGTGTGDFTITVTTPAAYAGGPYATDLSNEIGGNLNFEQILIAPQLVVKAAVARTTGASDVVGSTYTATPGLWVYDAADTATDTITGRWHLDGVSISPPQSALTYTTTAVGALTYFETFTGAGDLRSGVSNSIAIAAGTAAINTITYDTAGALVDYTGTLGATYDTAGVLLEAT